MFFSVLLSDKFSMIRDTVSLCSQRLDGTRLGHAATGCQALAGQKKAKHGLTCAGATNERARGRRAA